ncbi:MAG: hypothetical protein ACOCXX_01160 [Planctomycetota bacterium]
MKKLALHLVLVLLTVGCRQVETLPVPASHSLELHPVATRGVIRSGDVLTLMDRAIVQQREDMIVVEAEDALEFDFQDGIGLLKSGRSTSADSLVQVYARDRYEYAPQKSPEASGGAYVDYCHQAVYSITVTEPGTYTRWSRHWRPSAGSWVYHEQVDTGPRSRLKLGGPLKQWYWEKSGSFKLDAGTHTFTFTNLHNGKRIDKFLFTRDPSYTPTGMGPAATRHRKLDVGQVVYRVDPPSALLGWDRLRAMRASRAGTVRYEYSLAGGRTWKAFRDGLALEPADRKKTDRSLMIRLTFGRKNGRAPELRWLKVGFRSNTARLVKLVNDHLELTFNRDTGTLCGLSRRGGSTVRPDVVDAPLFAVFVKKPKQPGRWIEFDEATLDWFDTGSGSVSASHLMLDGTIRLNWRCEIDETPFTRWRVDVENDSAFDVLEVRFPTIDRVALGGNPDDDVLLWPYSAGEFYPVPCKIGTKEEGYPGHASFGYVDVFDADGGLYLGLADREMVASWCTSRPDTARRSITLSYTKKHRIKPGASREYNFELGVHPGDWHAAADRYREGFFRRFDKPDYPEWLVQSDGWICGHAGLFMHNRPRNYDEVRRYVWLRGAEMGCNYVQSWGSTLSNACLSYYLPRKECGGEELFARMNRTWTAAGGHLGYYFHGNGISSDYFLRDTYFDTPWDDYPEEVRLPGDWDWFTRHRHYRSEDAEFTRADALAQHEKGLKRRGGKDRPIENYVRMNHVVDDHFDYLRKWTDKYILDYHTDVIYYDTMAFGADQPEFNPHLGHHGEGSMVMNRLDFLEGNIDRLRPRVPSYTQLTEGCGDLYGQSCFFLLSGFSRQPDVLRYTFPEMILFEGHANGSWHRRKHKTSLAKAWAYGNKFDIITRSDWVDRLLATRQVLSPWLARARFLGDLGLEKTDANLLAKLHTVDHEGSRAVLVTWWNRKPADGSTVTVDVAHPKIGLQAVPATALLFVPGQAPRPLVVKRQGRRGTFEVPDAMVGAALLIERVGSEQQLGTSVRYDGRDVVLTMMNYLDSPLPVAVAMETGQARIETPTRALVLQPGLHEERFACTNAGQLNIKSLVALDVSTERGSRRLLSAAGPIVEDGDFEFYFYPPQLISTEEAFTGKRSFRAGLGTYFGPTNPAYGSVWPRNVPTPGYVRREVVLVPGKRYRATVAVKGTPDEKGIYAWGNPTFCETPDIEWKKTPEAGDPFPWADPSSCKALWYFKKTGEVRGWQIWSVEFTAPGRTTLVVRAPEGRTVLVDDLKVVPVEND